MNWAPEGKSGSSVAEPPAENPAPELKEPTWFEQTPKDFRGNERTKALWKYQKMHEVGTALLDAEDRLSRAIVIPNQDNPNPEELKAFREKLGLPENEAGYELDTAKYKDIPGVEQAAEAFRKLFLQTSLNKIQAGKMFDSLMGMQRSTIAAREKAKAQEMADYDTKLVALHNGDAASAQETDNLYRAFMARHFPSKDLITRLADRGILRDPEFAVRIGALGRLMQDERHVEGSEGGSAGKKAPIGNQGSYSADWIAATEGGGLR
jgi:hypothetical protein